MLGTELVVTATLCFASADSYMSINSSYVEDNPERSGFWCVAKAQLIILTFFEGGLLCLRN
jgi:hypothetical protein